jgi:hypothetical protein
MIAVFSDSFIFKMNTSLLLTQILYLKADHAIFVEFSLLPQGLDHRCLFVLL